MRGQARAKVSRGQMLFSAVVGFLPWIAGFLAPHLTRNILWLTVVGIVACTLPILKGYSIRQSADRTTAKIWLLAEPFLFGSYYTFAVVLSLYVFTRR